jgi:hypothetical protein
VDGAGVVVADGVGVGVRLGVGERDGLGDTDVGVGDGDVLEGVGVALRDGDGLAGAELAPWAGPTRLGDCTCWLGQNISATAAAGPAGSRCACAHAATPGGSPAVRPSC